MPAPWQWSLYGFTMPCQGRAPAGSYLRLTRASPVWQDRVAQKDHVGKCGAEDGFRPSS